jgi:hypothetical protein
MIANDWIRLAIAGGIVMLMGLVGGPLKAAEDMAPHTENPVCLECHHKSNINTNEGIAAANAFCTNCHNKPDCSRRVDGTLVSLQVSPTTPADTPHHYSACIHCHTDVARSPHRSESGARCGSCHSAHGEGTAHAPHLRVDCQACHFKSDEVRMDPRDGRIKLARNNVAGEPISIVDHGLTDATDEKLCLRCHHSGNTIGASAVVLPAKSLLCVVCHPAPASMGHALFWVALVILLLGLTLMLRFWFIGTVQGEEKSLHRKIGLSSDALWQTIFSRQIWTVLKVLFLDILLQRRILKESVQRWSLHTLIYLAMVARFALSLLTGLLFSINPDGDLALALMNKNHPATAFVYDLLGLFIFLGVLWAAIQRLIVKPAHVTAEIEDNITLVILGALVALGFVTTAARLLMTQVPMALAMYSFVGFSLSRLLALLPIDWPSVYPILWYAHAVLGAVLIAYLPFGKLKHIFNVPLTYFLEEVFGITKEKRV